MTPKEKSKDLINKFGKKLALKVVDEIIESSPSLPILGDAGLYGEDIQLSTKYFKEVKEELIKQKEQ
jgi:hypothetical protein